MRVRPGLTDPRHIAQARMAQRRQEFTEAWTKLPDDEFPVLSVGGRFLGHVLISACGPRCRCNECRATIHDRFQLREQIAAETAARRRADRRTRVDKLRHGVKHFHAGLETALKS